MLIQAGALALLAAAGGALVQSRAAAVLLGIATALVYPTLIAAVSDAVPLPSGRQWSASQDVQPVAATQRALAAVRPATIPDRGPGAQRVGHETGQQRPHHEAGVAPEAIASNDAPVAGAWSAPIGPSPLRDAFPARGRGIFARADPDLPSRSPTTSERMILCSC